MRCSKRLANKLAASGVPVAIALRAMASAIEANGRSRERCSFPKGLSRYQLALGVLLGALKTEWCRDPDATSGVASFSASLDALRDQFDVGQGARYAPALHYDMLFCDAVDDQDALVGL